MNKRIISIIQNNKWYYIPVLIWILAGGFCLFFFNRDELFFPINQNHNYFLDKLMTGISGFGRGDIIPFFLAPIAFIPAFRNKLYMLTATLFGIFIPLVIYFTKLIFNRPRPINFYGKEKVHFVPWLDNLYNNSFPSGHTFAAFGFFLILSILLPAKQKIWSLLFFILALLCGYSRIYLGQHFFQDVYAGSVAGVILTTLIYALVKWSILKKQVYE